MKFTEKFESSCHANTIVENQTVVVSVNTYISLNESRRLHSISGTNLVRCYQQSETGCLND